MIQKVQFSMAIRLGTGADHVRLGRALPVPGQGMSISK